MGEAVEQAAQPLFLVLDLAPDNGDKLVPGVQRFANRLDLSLSEFPVVGPPEALEEPGAMIEIRIRRRASVQETGPAIPVTNDLGDPLACQPSHSSRRRGPQRELCFPQG